MMERNKTKKTRAKKCFAIKIKFEDILFNKILK